MFVLKAVPAVIVLLYLLVFAAPIRAYIWDISAVFIIPFALLVILTSCFYFKSIRERTMPRKYMLLVCLFFLEMVVYLINYDGITTFTNAFHFFAQAFYLVAVVTLFDRNAVNQRLMKFFKVVFIVESLVIIVEAVDEFLGFDVHTARLFAWYLEVDNRFDEHIFVSNSNVPDLEILPIALGIHGFPHYTAPLYVVSFIFTVAQAFSQAVTNSKLTRSKHGMDALLLIVGLFCIYILGVKTHFLTATLAILILGVFLSTRILWIFTAFLGVAVPTTLILPLARLRFENFLDQVLVGNPLEGSRLDVIFNFREYLVLLDLKIVDLLLGTGSFSSINQFTITLFLEQKLLVYALVFGIPYILVVIGFFAVGLSDSVRVFRGTKNPATRATAIAVGCGLMVYGLEMGHFGFTFNTPNFPLVFVMLGMIAVLSRQINRDRTMLPHV